MKHFRKSINLKGVLVVLGSALALGLAVHFLHAFQVRRNAGILLSQAEKAESAGQIPKAIDYLHRYLSLSPQSHEALARYGTLLADPSVAKTRRALEKAYLVLEQALRQEPSRENLRRRVVQMALQLERPTDALEHLKRLDLDRDAQLLSLRGRCHEALREFPMARASYQAALQLPDHDWLDYGRLAYLLRRQPAAVMLKEGPGAKEASASDVHAAADAAIADLLRAHGKSFKVHLFVASYVREFATPQDPAKAKIEAAKHVEEALQLAPDEVEVQLAYAELKQETNEIDSARAILDRALRLHPESWRTYQALARLEMFADRPEAALQALRTGMNKLPQQIDLQWNLAHLLTYQGRNQEAAEVVANLGKQGFPQSELEYLHARIHAGQEQWLQAVQLLEKGYPHLLIRADQQRDWLAIDLIRECNLLFARCYEQLGDPDAAAAAYGRVVARFPQSVAGHIGLARMEWALGRWEIALREYAVARQLPKPPAAAWIESAQLLILRNLQSTQPDWPTVERLLNEAEKLQPAPVEVGLLRAELLVGRQQFDQARSLLEKNHQDKQTRPVEIWVGLANVEQQRGRADEALALLQEAAQRCGDRLELREARCHYWTRRGGPEAARALDEIGQNVEKLKAEEKRRLLPTLAECYLRLGEFKRAEAMWRRIADRLPNDLACRMASFDLALHDRSDERMDQLVGEIKRIEGETGALWRYCRACQLIGQAQEDRTAQHDDRELKTLAAARDLLDTVARKRMNWARVPLAQAQIGELLDDFETAIAKYRDAVLLGIDNPAVIRRVVQLLSSRGRYLEADEMIQRLRGQRGAVGDLDRFAAEIALWKQDPQLALRLAEKAVVPESKDYRDHVWLGQMKWAAGKNADAEQEVRRAIQLAPDVPDTWVALVSHLVRGGAKDKALATIAEAQKALPKDRANLALAQCFEMVDPADENKQAKKLYDVALAASPNDGAVLKQLAYFHLRKGEHASAKQYLERIIQLKAISANQRADANRALALVLGTAGDYQQTVRALEHLSVLDVKAEKIQPLGRETIADQRAKIIVLAAAQNPRQRRQAIRLLEDLLHRRQLTPDDRFLLAQLYDAVGEWSKARDHFLVLVSSAPSALANEQHNPAVQKKYADQLASFCAGLLRHDAANQAEFWLSKLEDLEPKSFRTVSLHAQLLGKRGQADKAVPELVALAERENQAVRVALLLEQLALVKDAEEMFQKNVAQSKRPEAVLTLAAFLGRQKRTNEALALCDAARKTCRFESVASVAVLVLYSGKSTEDQCRTVAGWLQAAIAQDSKAVSLLTHLAAVRRLQNDYAGVVALYRQALAQDSNDTLTLNNLAWLLALNDRDSAGALQAIQRAIELDGPQADLLDTRAVAYLAAGDAGKAVKDLEEAIAERPTAQRYFHLAQAHRLAKDRPAAMDAFQRALRLGINETTVDPLELTIYQQLRNELEAKSAAAR
jgi:tetratricopeptide (TPR) repeat protein